jgi:hypothetical protein
MARNEVVFETKVQYRDEFGRFARVLEDNAERAAADLVDAAYDAAYQAAPERTGAFKRSLGTRMAGKIGFLFSTHPAAKHIEEGAGAHEMERGGRTFTHPGSPAHHTLEAGRQAAHAQAETILKRNF